MQELSSNPRILRLDPGEKVIETLTNWATTQDITGTISGIGAVKNPSLAFYDTSTKQYLPQDFEGEYELLQLTGSLAMTESGIRAHLHCSLAGKDFSALGGHLVEATVSVTLEIVVFKAQLYRQKQTDSPLWLLSDNQR